MANKPINMEPRINFPGAYLFVGTAFILVMDVSSRSEDGGIRCWFAVVVISGIIVPTSGLVRFLHEAPNLIGVNVSRFCGKSYYTGDGRHGYREVVQGIGLKTSDRHELVAGRKSW
ncbi:MAG: hypothetical protein ACR2PG_22100 [Hyphomicrobiaceae bacterium]